MSVPARNWQLVRHTEAALRTGSESLGNVPALLRALLEESAWREFALPNGEAVAYRRFSEFAAARPPRGLDTDLSVIHKLSSGDPDLLVMLREAEKVGRGRRTELAGESPASVGDDQTGKTADRLARDHPAEYAAVQSGALSINAAAVLAGIRPRRISVRLDRPESVARSLRKHLTADQMAELVALLHPATDDTPEETP